MLQEIHTCGKSWSVTETGCNACNDRRGFEGQRLGSGMLCGQGAIWRISIGVVGKTGAGDEQHSVHRA